MNRARGAGALLLATLALVVLAGCGGSVADRDRPRNPRPDPVPASPFCVAVQAGADAARPLTGLTTRGGSPEELASTVAAIRRSNDELISAAPQEIRPDVERYVRVTNLQLDALVANGGDAVALARDTELSAQVNAPENVSANQRVQNYVRQTCTPEGDAG